MQFINVENIIEKYGKYVVQQSRSRLTRAKKGGGPLYNSLSYKPQKIVDGYLLKFFMEDYGEFVDKGVMGKNPSNLSPNATKEGQQAPNSPYKFGSGNYAGTWKTFLSNIELWAKRKNVRFRQPKGNSKGGQYKEGNYKSLAYIIATNIYNRGIAPTDFFTTPFNRAQERLGKELFDGFIIDVQKIIEEEN